MTLTNQKGQTLMEIVFVVAIIIIGLSAIMSLIIFNVSASRVSRSRIAAYNLAREGLESVRYIRDSNWLNAAAGLAWDEGLYNNLNEEDHTAIACFSPSEVSSSDNMLSVWRLDFQPVDFTDQATLMYIDKQFVANEIALYYQDSAGPYSDTSQISPYRRLLTLDYICSDGAIKEAGEGVCDSAPGITKVGIRVISEVRWQERGQAQSVIVEDWLYDWYK